MDKLVEIHNYRAMAKEMKRIADALETFVAVYSAKCHADGYTVPNPKLTAEERALEVTYTDPEAEALNEVRRAMGQIVPEDLEEEP